MLIDQFCSQSNGSVSFSRQQASDFAKKIADDYNPLHNLDAKRFCVPGDLLFALVLAHYGVSQHMLFTFSGMVTDEVSLNLPEYSSKLSLLGNNDKEYLSIEMSGQNSSNSVLIDQLTRSYVTFSGHTFPHILIPLMQAKNVMINPDRPMVMYQSMLIDLERFDLTNIDLQLDKEKTVLEVDGKRGNVCLAFNLLSGRDIVGRGEKHMVLSGLRPFETQAVDQVISNYSTWKKIFR
jgi:hypothetical protein